MSKITVKHYLNVNLKPYIVNGEKLYSVYILVIAQRQNTKVKSYSINGIYTESQFNSFLGNKECEEFLAMESERITIENIVKTLIESIKDEFKQDIMKQLALFYGIGYNEVISIANLKDIINEGLDTHEKREQNENGLWQDIPSGRNEKIIEICSKLPQKVSYYIWFSDWVQSVLRAYFVDSVVYRLNETVLGFFDVMIQTRVFAAKYEKIISKYN